MNLLSKMIDTMIADKNITMAQRYYLLENARREIDSAIAIILVNSQPDLECWQHPFHKTPGALFADGSSLPEGTL